MTTVRDEYGFSVSKGEIGIEIEMEGDKEFPNAPTNWHATSDGSLRGHSVEYISDGPIQLNYLKEHLQTLKNAIEKAKVKVSASFRAGVHVHINVREFTIEEVVNFALLYYIFDHAFAKYCGPNREGNLFCLRIS